MHWFSTEFLPGGVELLTEPAVHPYFRANLYRISGRDFDIHLDFGNGVAPLPSAAVDKPVLAIATHAHVDHVGGFHAYGRRAGHALEARTFAEMDDEGTFASWLIEFPGVLERAPNPAFDISAFALKPAPLTETLAEGDVVDTGDRRFRVLHLPGHSPGSIALMDERDGMLFSGDAVYDDDLIDDLPGSDVEAYCRTMERLIRLDVRIVHGGHGRAFDGPRLREIALGYLGAKGR